MQSIEKPKLYEIVIVGIGVAGIAALMFFFSNDGSNARKEYEKQEKPNTDTDQVITRGNHSYISLRQDPLTKGEDVRTILRTINDFEKAHPEWKVTNWKPDEGGNSFTLGIWVDHEPREAPKEGQGGGAGF